MFFSRFIRVGSCLVFFFLLPVSADSRPADITPQKSQKQTSPKRLSKIPKIPKLIDSPLEIIKDFFKEKEEACKNGGGCYISVQEHLRTCGNNAEADFYGFRCVESGQNLSIPVGSAIEAKNMVIQCRQNQSQCWTECATQTVEYRGNGTDPETGGPNGTEFEACGDIYIVMMRRDGECYLGGLGGPGLFATLVPVPAGDCSRENFFPGGGYQHPRFRIYFKLLQKESGYCKVQIGCLCHAEQLCRVRL